MATPRSAKPKSFRGTVKLLQRQVPMIHGTAAAEPAPHRPVLTLGLVRRSQFPRLQIL